jgi:hypothetical protein
VEEKATMSPSSEQGYLGPGLLITSSATARKRSYWMPTARPMRAPARAASRESSGPRMDLTKFTQRCRCER